MAANRVAETFLTLLDWALRWWLSGEEPGWSLIRSNLIVLRPVIQWAAGTTLAVVIVAAATMVMLRRRGSDLAEVALGMGRFLLVLVCGWIFLAAGWSAADAIGRWIIGSSPDPSSYLDSVTAALADAEPALAVMLSVVGLSAVLGFIAVVLARVVVVVVLVAGVPVMAAASVLTGGAGLRKAWAWLAAVLLFRPVVSVIYRVSHDLVAAADEPVVILLVVTMTFLLSAASLPAVAHVVAGAAR